MRFLVVCVIGALVVAGARSPKAWGLGVVPAPPTLKVHYGEFTVPDGQDLGPTGGYSNGATGDVFLRTRERRPRRNFALNHEVFHALDAQVLTDRDRARIQRVLGLQGAWNQGTGATAGGLKSPSELAADNFAAVATGLDPRHQMDGGYASGYDAKQLRRFGALLGRLMERRHLERLDLRRY